MSAWKGTDLLAEAVPVLGGKLSVSGDQEVPERLTFTVPEFADGRSWVPESPADPLNKMGQYVTLGILTWSSVVHATPEDGDVTQLGRFQIQDWDWDDAGGTVSVECVGLLQKPLDARFRTPQVPRPTGTFTSEFRRLMVPGLPVVFHDHLEDRRIPQSFEWNEDRLAALYEICDAWPARMRVDSEGTVRVLPPLPEQANRPVLTFTDGERGTVISAPRTGTRDGVFNVVVARSSATDDTARPPVQAVAAVTSGPLEPSTYGEVVKFWSSPLATTYAQLAASARTLLANAVRPGLVQRATIVPDPRIELDDEVRLIRAGKETRGFVIGYDLPLTVHDGAMTVDVGVA